MSRVYKFIDLQNKRFGRLTVFKRNGVDKNRHILWECICDCGETKIVAGTSLIEGHTNSCGCYFKEVIGNLNRTHGKCYTKVYYVYRGMLHRCYGNEKKYAKRYKGKIFVSDRWLESFQNFYDDMFPTYKHGLTLDRIDNNGNYELSNCRWTTPKIQSNNKSNNKLYTIGKDTFNVEGWEKISGTNKSTISSRISRGWSVERAVYTNLGFSLENISQYLVF